MDKMASGQITKRCENPKKDSTNLQCKSKKTQNPTHQVTTESVNLPAKTKNPSASRVSSYAKTSTTQRQESNISSNTNPGAMIGSSKAKIISSLPFWKPTCTSAPATVTRLPGMRKTTTNPPLKVKQGACSASPGVTRESQSACSIQPPHQRQATYMMVPVRLKRAGLKLLDPEKVKNLATLAAAGTFVSGEERLHSQLYQVQASKQRPLNSRQRAVLRSPAKQMSTSRKFAKIHGIRQDSNPPVKQEKTSGDHESHLLNHKIGGLVIREKDGSESSSCNTAQEPYDAQTLPHLITNQKCVRKQVGRIDCSSLEESNNDQLKLLTLQTMSTRKKKIILDTVNTDVKEEGLNLATKKIEVIQGLLEEDKELDCELNLSSKDNQVEGLQLEVASDALTPVDALNNQQGDASANTQSQEDLLSPRDKTKSQQNVTSSQDILKKSPRPNDTHSTNEKCVSFPAEDIPFEQKIIKNCGPAEENIDDMGVSSSLEDTQSHISSRDDVIRSSQGVLVLTSSTDENAVFIPKLKFEFTPDNSIDWAMLPQSLTNNYGDQVKEKGPRITKPCTPRGPSFSKSVLKKSSASQKCIPTAGGNSKYNPRSLEAERSAEDSCPPLYGIVDLSISFQGKYEGDKIPKDIPKILLTEEDSL